MNKLDLDYQNLLKDILENGIKKEDRTGTGTISVFGRQIRHKMSDGFPLLTTKKMFMKGIVTELLWFLRGDTNIKYLVDNDCHIWDGDTYKKYLIEEAKISPNMSKEKMTELGYRLTKEDFINKIKTDDEFAKKWGELGPVYGKQWRNWCGYEKIADGWEHGAVTHYKEVPKCDQIVELIQQLKTNPDSRRLMVNAWNVAEINQMTLPPCHYGFQVYTRELSLEERYQIVRNKQDETWKNYYNYEKFELDFETGSIKIDSTPTRAISLMWNQRSVDTFLGLPFNIASYGLLLEIIAKEVNMVPDELIGNLGDTHLYSDHIEQAKEQIGREMTIEERMHWWFENNKPNRDVCDYVDMLPIPSKNIYLDEAVVPKRTREPYPLPKLNFSWYINSWTTEEAKKIREDSFDTYIRQIKPTDFNLENYHSHPTIKAPLSN